MILVSPQQAIIMYLGILERCGGNDSMRFSNIIILCLSSEAWRIPEFYYLKISSLSKHIIVNLEMSLKEEKCVGDDKT